MTAPLSTPVSLFSDKDNPYPGGNSNEWVVSDDTGSDEPQPSKQKLGIEPIPGKGPLLEQTDLSIVAKKPTSLWKRQDVPMQRRAKYWELYSKWRRGIRGIFVDKIEDTNIWRVWSLPGASKQPMPDRTDELVQRTVAQLLADDPLPEADPEKDDAESRDAAEFSERLLTAETGDQGIDAPDLLKTALNKAGTYCSGFITIGIDPHGKGFEPEQRMAHPNATVAAQPQCMVDPETGQVTSDLVLRYVAADGITLTDDPSKAKRNWKPALKADVLTGKHVRFLPEVCKGIEDADGQLVAKYTTKGALKGLFPVCETFTDDQWRKMAEFTVPKAKRLLPSWARDYLLRTKGDEFDKSGELPDEAPILTIALTMRDTPEYEDGCYIVVSGDEVLWRQTWYGTWKDVDGVQHGECLMLPTAQIRWWDDAEDDDPYGRTVVEKLGPWDEVFAAQLSSELDWAFRFNNPNVFLPFNSTVQGKMLARRDGTPIILGTPGDKPEYEVVPPWPANSRELRDDARDAMNQTAGLLATGGGSADENTLGNSGIQAQTIVAQAGIGLSGVRSNIEKGYVRLLAICAQQIKCFYSAADRISYVGEDGAYKEKEWTGADLASAKTFRLKRGSMTGMDRQAKANYIQSLVQLGLDPAEARRLLNENLSGQIGAQDNPYMMRVRRQITRWQDGPGEIGPDGKPVEGSADQWAQQAVAYGQAKAQAQQAAQQPPQPGQPPQAQPQLPSEPFNPFDPLPIDDEAPIATIRHQELSRHMCRAKFSKWSGPWRALYLAEFDKARKAAGLLTVAEQAQAAQAAAKNATDMKTQTELAKESAQTQGDIARDNAKAAADRARITLEAQLESTTPAATPTLPLR